MESKELLEKIKADVNDAKLKGNESIQLDNLLAYLSDIVLDNEKVQEGIRLEGVKHQNSTELEILKINNSFQIESFKAAINIGANACRTFLIMNGGAAIALLAFLGNIWNKESSVDAAFAIATALSLFCMGVVFAGLCSGLSYFSQCLFASSELGARKLLSWSGHFINTLACLCGAGSIYLFGYGSYSAYQSMIAQLVK